MLALQTKRSIKQRQSDSRTRGKDRISRAFLLKGVVFTLLLWAPRSAPAHETTLRRDVTVTTSNGAVIQGKLVHLDNKNVTVSDTSKTPSRTSTLEISSVRKIHIESPSTDSNEVVVGLVDGSYIKVNDVSTDDTKAYLSLGDSTFEVPREAVHWIVFGDPQSDSPETDTWLKELPEKPAADLVAIKRDTMWQFIECAITQITPKNVVVLLDGESIPVNRSKIFGLCWLRPSENIGKDIEPNAKDILLHLQQGRIRCRNIKWNNDQLHWEVALPSVKNDFIINLPADSLSSIDFAFGRHIDLTERLPADSRTDPYFGGLANDPILLQYFAPRSIMVADSDNQDASVPALLIHPRTEITWTIPNDSRRFQASLSLAENSVSPAVVMIQIDNSEVFKTVVGNPEAQRVDTPPLTVDLDLDGGKQLKIIVDFLKKPLDGTNEQTMVSLLSGSIQVKNPRIER